MTYTRAIILSVHLNGLEESGSRLELEQWTEDGSPVAKRLQWTLNGQVLTPDEVRLICEAHSLLAQHPWPAANVE